MPDSQREPQKPQKPQKLQQSKQSQKPQKPHRSQPQQARQETQAQFLAAYNPDKYPHPSVTVDMLIFTIRDEMRRNYRRLPQKTLQLLLVRRGRHPFLGQWALPGGFVHIDESLEEAAMRELREETSVSGVYLEQLYTWGDVDRDPRTRVISTSWLALADCTKLEPKADDDAAEVAWFTVRCEPVPAGAGGGSERVRDFQLTLTSGEHRLEAGVRLVETIAGNVLKPSWHILGSSGLAFDHAKIIAYGIERLRSKISHTDIAFHLLPDTFTLTALQQVHEVVLGRELLKANFRRKTANMVIETGESTRSAGHRPSMLYRFDPEWRLREERGEES